MSKLFKKTLIIMVLLFGVISTCVSLLSAWNVYRGMSQEFVSKGQSIARIIADASISPLMSDYHATLQSMIDQYLEILGVSYVLVTDESGQVVAHTFVPAVPEDVREITRTMPDHHRVQDMDAFGTRASHTPQQIHVIAPIVGGVAGHVVVGMDKSIIRQQILSIIIQQQLLIFILFLISVVICYFLIERISRPLVTLNRHAERLATTDLTELQNFHQDIDAIANRSNDEIGALARSFIYMEQELDSSIKRLAENVAEQQRITTELEVASDIQMQMLPSPEDLRELDSRTRIEARLRPAKEVGGDFYECFALENESDDGSIASRRLFFAVGDVAGKGVPAALFMSLTCSLLRSRATGIHSPAELLETVNRELSLVNPSCMFVTLFCGVYDPGTGELTCCSAGHNPPYILSPTRGLETVKTPNNMALGAMENVDYAEQTLNLQPAETLVLFTDGVTEASNAEQELYAEQRLEAMLQQCRSDPPAEIVARLEGDVDRFVQSEPQADDITLLVIQRNDGA